MQKVNACIVHEIALSTRRRDKEEKEEDGFGNLHVILVVHVLMPQAMLSV